MIWGPFVSNYEKVLSASPGALGTVSSFRDLFDRTDYPQNIIGHIVDVRDVARAHVLALSAPPLPNKEHKRLISSNRNFTWEEAVKVIREKCAAEERIQKRLPEKEAAAHAVKQVNVPLDDSLTRTAIGFGEFTPFEDTVVATFEAFSLWEKTFKN
jgi:nucleoside-diphosphate-sugar epimerase